MPHALQTRLSRRTLLAGTAAVALPWLQAGSANAQESQIVLGQSTDLTGPLGELGSAMHQGAQAAFAAVNARGGIQGRSIVLNTLDEAERRNRAMHRSLRSAEALPEPEAQGILGLPQAGTSLTATDEDAD